MSRAVARLSRSGALRPLVSRPFSWESLGRKVEADADAKADYNGLKAYWDGIEKDHAAWSKPVAPINWAHYKNEIEASAFVDFLKARYDAIDWSQISHKLSDADMAADRSEKDALLAKGKEIVAEAEKLIAETSAKLELAEAKKTTRDSLVEDVWAKHPKIKEEVLNEINDHEWFKDTGMYVCMCAALIVEWW